jgi:hypothetical protein
LPRTPAKRTRAMVKPRGGISRSSMPPRTPSHTAFQPCARKCSATASAGKMCPPVPPAMIMMVRHIP